MANIKFTDLLGSDFKDYNYAVTSNWRIDFSKSTQFTNLLGNDAKVVSQLSYALHSDYDFTASITYAEASIKGIPIRQAAWQERAITGMTCAVYESMDHRVFKALESACSNVAGFCDHRDINLKENYTFSGIVLQALGNVDGAGEPPVVCAYELIGAQINDVKSPTYTSTAANIADVTFTLYAHGWKVL